MTPPTVVPPCLLLPRRSPVTPAHDRRRARDRRGHRVDTWLTVHLFLALIIGSAVLGATAGFGLSNTVDSFTNGVGSTVGSVGLLIALGAVIGGLLADSGGADLFVSSVVGRVSRTALPWAMMAVAALVGLSLF